MAISFEMQVDFENDRIARRIFCEYMADKLAPVTINDKKIQFHLPRNTFATVPADAWTNISICPMNIGHRVSYDKGKFIPLSDDEMFELSMYMYQSIKQAPGYLCALVGWELGNMNSIIENFRQNHEYIPDGLVLHKEKYKDLKLDKLMDFDREHVWCPLESAFSNVFGEDED